MRKFAALAAMLALTMGALTACVQQEPKVKPTAIAKPIQTQQPPNLEEFYQQELEWEGCQTGFECAQLRVPLDYDNPNSGEAQIALRRMSSGNENKLGTIVANPGGPGASGIDSMMTAQAANYFFTQNLRNNFDVLSFDPRGVGSSTPSAKCRTPEQLDEDNERYIDPSTPQGREESIQESKLLAQRCQQKSGEILPFTSTDFTARDMDILRASLGEERLNYLGFSYGTYLGAVYADLFPQRVGRFVLDGVLDPSANINQVAALQAQGFENSIREFVAQCLERHASECPLRGSTDDGMRQLQLLIESLVDVPLSTKYPDRELTVQLALTGMIGSLYNTATWWTTLMPALNQAINERDGTALLNSADTYNNRMSDGSYENNQSDAFMMINALDYSPVGDLKDWEKEAARLQAENPTIGRFFTYASLGLDQWPVSAKSEAKRQINPQLDADILLIGTTGDPATPLSMAQSLHRQMDKSRLLTVQGWNHTAYSSYAPRCVRDVVDNYMLAGVISESQSQGVCSLS